MPSGSTRKFPHLEAAENFLGSFGPIFVHIFGRWTNTYKKTDFSYLRLFILWGYC